MLLLLNRLNCSTLSGGWVEDARGGKAGNSISSLHISKIDLLVINCQLKMPLNSDKREAKWPSMAMIR